LVHVCAGENTAPIPSRLGKKEIRGTAGMELWVLERPGDA